MTPASSVEDRHMSQQLQQSVTHDDTGTCQQQKWCHLSPRGRYTRNTIHVGMHGGNRHLLQDKVASGEGKKGGGDPASPAWGCTGPHIQEGGRVGITALLSLS